MQHIDDEEAETEILEFKFDGKAYQKAKRSYFYSTHSDCFVRFSFSHRFCCAIDRGLLFIKYKVIYDLFNSFIHSISSKSALR